MKKILLSLLPLLFCIGCTNNAQNTISEEDFKQKIADELSPFILQSYIGSNMNVTTEDHITHSKSYSKLPIVNISMPQDVTMAFIMFVVDTGEMQTMYPTSILTPSFFEYLKQSVREYYGKSAKLSYSILNNNYTIQLNANGIEGNIVYNKDLALTKSYTKGTVPITGLVIDSELTISYSR